MSETTEHYDRVRLFMELAGQATPEAPTEMDAETRELRARLLIEEVFETIQRGLGVQIFAQNWWGPINAEHLYLSCENEQYDPIELLDGCCDVKVITTGTLIAAGLTDAQPQRLVDDNNLAKFGPGHSIRDDGKLIKAPDHQPPALAAEIHRQRAITCEKSGGA